MSSASETDFFHDIASAVIGLVRQGAKQIAIAEDKEGVGDYSTQVDVDTENLIVSELKDRFPGDQILAEENHSTTKVPAGRIWLIDPICGTSNLGKGINNYCTNIALADKGEVVAACVVDHGRQEYIWSVGQGKVYVGKYLYSAPSSYLGRKVDVDFGAVRNATPELRAKHHRFTRRLLEETDFDAVSLNSSLSFAYTAIGRTDGFVNLFNHPWDIAAAAFLIRQAGGTITGLDGSPWTVTTVGAIGGRTPEIHKELLDLLLES